MHDGTFAFVAKSGPDKDRFANALVRTKASAKAVCGNFEAPPALGLTELGEKSTPILEGAFGRPQSAVVFIWGITGEITPMANVKGPRDHSPAIEKLAAQKLRDPKASKDTKRLAGAVLAHADGKPAPKPSRKPPKR